MRFAKTAAYVIKALPLLAFGYYTVKSIQLNSDSLSKIIEGEKFSIKGEEKKSLKIGIVSSYIETDMWKNKEQKLNVVLDHITNKQCYCHLWNYNCILNQTRELSTNAIMHEIVQSKTNPIKDDLKNKWWLRFGTWERVPHIQATLPHNDWVLYTDMDYIFKDFSRPIESFIRELDLHGKKNVHVILPTDRAANSVEAFSAFATLIKNSPFGRRVMENWRDFAMGICPNGNFASKNREYDWQHSDQPGLWYALMKTHMEYFPNENLPPSIIECDNNTGLIDDSSTGPWLGFQDYFVRNGYVNGNYGLDLDKVPDDQPIIFSKSGNDTMSGLGVDHNWVYNKETGEIVWNHAFALHQNSPSEEWDPEMQLELAMCKRKHGCFSELNKEKIETGCTKDMANG